MKLRYGEKHFVLDESVFYEMSKFVNTLPLMSREDFDGKFVADKEGMDFLNGLALGPMHLIRPDDRMTSFRDIPIEIEGNQT